MIYLSANNMKGVVMKYLPGKTISDKPYKEFQTLIKQFRAKLNLSETEFAKSLGVPSILIEKIESGHSETDITNGILYKLYAVYNLNVLPMIRNPDLFNQVDSLIKELETATILLASQNRELELLREQNELLRNRPSGE